MCMLLYRLARPIYLKNLYLKALVPTSHRFQLGGQVLYTWCAFDTVLLPPSLHVEAQVQSTCPVTGQPITFVATPEGVIRDLSPASGVMVVNRAGQPRRLYASHLLPAVALLSVGAGSFDLSP